MDKLKQVVQSAGFSLLVVMQLSIYTFTLPFPVAAQASEDTSSVTQQAETQSTDTTQENSDSAAPEEGYTYNEETGMWENEKYIWDPTTRQTKPKESLDYSYNPETERWDTTEWVYSPDDSKYIAPEPKDESTYENTNNNQGEHDDDGVSTATTTTQQRTLDTEPLETLNSEPQKTMLSDSEPSAYPTSEGSITDNRSGVFDLFYDATISNQLKADSKSGDALVQGNTIGGSATSGDSTSIATIMNLLQSSWGMDGGLATFDSTIFGDVFGDIHIDPDSLAKSSVDRSADLEVNAVTNNTINNDINLTATSGNATVDKNTQAGDATTGTALAMANVLNMINSFITSGQSFMGSLTIEGDLEGDVLLPPSMLEKILAAGRGAYTETVDIDLDVDTTNNHTINNNITAEAESGNALVSNNTDAGNATTGAAETSITILNLANSSIHSEDALLVFVNVLGRWVGVIMDAPEGVNSALVGGGVQTNRTLDVDADVNIENNATINNDIAVSAKSGDASVTNNTEAGDATTGDAAAHVNLANITNTSIATSNWFGVLFINVLGDWFGSFGVDTPYGNPVHDNQESSKQSNTNQKSSTARKTANDNGDVFTFQPGTPRSSSDNNHPDGALSRLSTFIGQGSDNKMNLSTDVLRTESGEDRDATVAGHVKNANVAVSDKDLQDEAPPALIRSRWPSVIAGISLLGLIGGDRLIHRIRGAKRWFY